MTTTSKAAQKIKTFTVASNTKLQWFYENIIHLDCASYQQNMCSCRDYSIKQLVDQKKIRSCHPNTRS